MVFKGWTKNMMDIYLKWRNDKFYFLKTNNIWNLLISEKFDTFQSPCFIICVDTNTNTKALSFFISWKMLRQKIYICAHNEGNISG